MKRVHLLLLIAFLASVQPGEAQRLAFRSGIFLHHSTGGKIWSQPGSSTSVPAEIEKYNALHGLAGADAVRLDELSWPPTPWENEWERWHRIFLNQDTVDADIRLILEENPIVIIKSCYPSSSLSRTGNPSDTLSPTSKTIYNYKWHWRAIVAAMREHPDNFFVIWTNAPLVAGATSAASASLSDQFCRWAKDTLAEGIDPAFGPFPENVHVFDFFHILAGPDGMLPEGYAHSPTNSHPNAAATDLAAPLFARETFDHALQYESLPSGVTYSSFRATTKDVGGEVLLEWTTTNEFRNRGFHVERRSGQNGEFIDLPGGFVDGHGTTRLPVNYSIVDSPLAFGSWGYRLRQIGLDSLTSFSDTVEALLLAGAEEHRPFGFRLSQNYPNPFNPSTQITFSVDARGRITLDVFGLLGERVATLVDGVVDAGVDHKVDFRGDGLSAGVYFCRLQTGERVAVRKMLLLK